MKFHLLRLWLVYTVKAVKVILLCWITTIFLIKIYSLFGMQLMVNASENILIRSEEHIKKFILKLTLFCLHIKSSPGKKNKSFSFCLQKAYLACFRNRTLTCKYRMYPGVRRGMRKNISAAALGSDQSLWLENQKGPVHTHTSTHTRQICHRSSDTCRLIKLRVFI